MAQTAPVLNKTAAMNNTAGSITIPSGTLVGDMMVLVIVYVGATGGGGTPAGWTQLLNQNFVGNAFAYATVCTRRAVAGDPGSAVALPTGTNPARAAQLSTWSNVGADAIVVGTQTSAATTETGGVGVTATAASLTTTDANCAVIDAFFGAESLGGSNSTLPTLSIPATASQSATVGNAAGSTSYGWGVGVSYQAQAAAGASTAKTATWTPGFTSSAVSGGVCGIQIALPPIQVPAAPTLTAPANALYEDMSGTPTFTWAYNPTAFDGAQNAVEFRQKVSGAGTYNYWNPGSSTFQSTPIYFTQTTGTITFPSGVWVNGNIYNWSVSTQEATESLQSAFASDFTVTAQAIPSAVVTGPTGTIQTVTPTVTATATVASGASVTAYRIVVYTAAQVAAGGFTPGTTTGVYDSGVVTWTSTAISQPVTGLANNVTYYAYIQITETGGETGSWASGVFTVSFDAPAVPTVAVTPSTDPASGAPILVIAVTGHDNLLSAVDASFEGSVGTAVTGSNTSISPSTDWAADGTGSCKMVSTAAGNMSVTEGPYPVTVAQRYTFTGAYHAAVSGRTCRTDIAWYNGATLISTTTGTTVADSSTGAAAAFPTAVAPASSTQAYLIHNVLATAAAAEAHYVDEAGIFPGTVTVWTRGGLVGTTTVDVWARTAATSTVTDPQRPATAGIRVAAALPPNSAQTVSWTDWAAASGAVYEYQAVVNGGAGIATPSVWTP